MTRYPLLLLLFGLPSMWPSQAHRYFDIVRQQFVLSNLSPSAALSKAWPETLKNTNYAVTADPLSGQKVGGYLSCMNLENL